MERRDVGKQSAFSLQQSVISNGRPTGCPLLFWRECTASRPANAVKWMAGSTAENLMKSSQNATKRPLVDIGEVIENGVVFNLRNWQREDVTMHGLPEAVERLFALLEERKIDYVLVGGVAMLQYVEGRNTQDIDLILAPEALSQLPEIEVTGREDSFARGKFAGLRVDFLFTSHKLFQSVRQQHSAVQPFQARNVRCATVEGMLLLKLFALPSLYRQGQFARVGIYENDIATLMQAYSPPVAPLLKQLEPHMSEGEMKSLCDIVEEIAERIRRFEAGRSSGS